MSLDSIPVPDGELDRLLIDMKFRRFLPYMRGRVLDVGCGIGIMTQHIHEAGFIVDGLDGSQERIKEAKIRCPKSVFYTSLFQDFNPKKQYDTIILSNVLEHFNEKDGDDLLKKCYSWLKPKGVLISAVPNSNALHKILYGSSELTKDDLKVGHIRTYNYVELNQQVVKAGFYTKALGGVLIKTMPNKYLKLLDKQIIEKWYNISNRADIFHLCSVVYVVSKK